MTSADLRQNNLQSLYSSKSTPQIWTPQISVIVPVYNGELTIAETIESLLNQNYPSKSYEILIVENGSKDNTSQIVRKYPVRLVHSPRRGPSVARNYGLNFCNSEFVAFTDADCIAHPDWLYHLAQPYIDPQVGGVGGQILGYQHEQANIIEKFSDQNSPLVNYISGEGEFLPHLYTANASYRKSLFDQIGWFNEKLVTADDVDATWRLQLETGARVEYSPDAIVYHKHRVTQPGLARQYKQYGFGEIVLDTMYGKYPGYPRRRSFQAMRMLKQTLALPRYMASAVLRRIRFYMGKASRYEAAYPLIWLNIESSNLRGKLEGLVATRFMTDGRSFMQIGRDNLMERFYQNRRE